MQALQLYTIRIWAFASCTLCSSTRFVCWLLRVARCGALHASYFGSCELHALQLYTLRIVALACCTRCSSTRFVFWLLRIDSISFECGLSIRTRGSAGGANPRFTHVSPGQRGWRIEQCRRVGRTGTCNVVCPVGKLRCYISDPKRAFPERSMQKG